MICEQAIHVICGKGQRTQNCIDTAGGIGRENQIFRVRANESRQRGSRLVQQTFQIAHEKLNRLPFQAISQILLKPEDGARATAKHDPWFRKMIFGSTAQYCASTQNS